MCGYHVIVKHTERVAPVAAAVAALATLTCCLPVGFAAAAALAGVAAIVAPLRPWLLGAAALLLIAGVRQFANRQRTCAMNPRGRRTSAAILWISTIVVVLVALFPQLVAGIIADWADWLP